MENLMCSECGYDAVEIGKDKFGRPIIECEDCGEQFVVTDLGMERVISEFETGQTYFFDVYSGPVARECSVEVISRSKSGKSIIVKANPYLRNPHARTVRIKRGKGTEFIQIKDLFGELKIYPE